MNTIDDITLEERCLAVDASVAFLMAAAAVRRAEAEVLEREAAALALRLHEMRAELVRGLLE
jgi:hypothetical protein